MSSEDEIARLKRRIAELEGELRSAGNTDHPGRTKIKEMSAEVVDSNPYRSQTYLIAQYSVYLCSYHFNVQPSDGPEAYGNRRQLPED